MLMGASPRQTPFGPFLSPLFPSPPSSGAKRTRGGMVCNETEDKGTDRAGERKNSSGASLLHHLLKSLEEEEEEARYKSPFPFPPSSPRGGSGRTGRGSVRQKKSGNATMSVSSAFSSLSAWRYRWLLLQQEPDHRRSVPYRPPRRPHLLFKYLRD